MDAIISEAQDAQYKLEVTPASTVEFVEALTFLDEIQDRIEPLDEMSGIVVQMYDLIERYKVPTPPEDFAVFKVCVSLLSCILLFCKKKSTFFALFFGKNI